MGNIFGGVFGTSLNKNTRQILDMILRRLVTETDMRDMYGLADPEICKKFVVFGAEAFNKLFLQVRLNKNKDGTLFFQQLKGLGELNPDPETQKKNCLQLANFFVSIFKIYAAITLSILDSEFPTTEVTDYRITRRATQRGVQFYDPQTGFKGFSRQPPGYMWGQRGFMQTPPQVAGGLDLSKTIDAALALPPETGVYRALNAYLQPLSRGNEYNFSIPLGFSDKGSAPICNLTIEQSELYQPYAPNDSDPPGPTKMKRTAKDSYPKGIETKGTVRIEQSLAMAARIVLEEGPTNITVGLEDISIDGKKLDPIQFNVALINQGDPTAGVQGPYENEGSKELPTLIALNITKAYKVKFPSTFVADEFLRSHGAIDNDSKFVDSNILVEADASDPTRIRIDYRPEERMKVRAEERPQKISIRMDASFERMKSGGSTRFKYHLILSLKNVKTVPDELYEAFEIYDATDADTGYKEAYFYTDSKDLGVPKTESGLTIGQWLERTIKSLLEKRSRMEDIVPYSTRPEVAYRQGMPVPYNSDRMPAGLRITDIWKALAKDPPVKPHCMARAMQLLNLAAIRGDDSNAFSRVCDTKFTLIKDGSLPEPGKSIASSYGIRALAMLFLNAIDGTADKLKSSSEYQSFRIKFKRYFEKYEEGFEEPSDPGKIEEVREKVMPFCKENLDSAISLDKNMTGQLRSKVFQLQNRQAQHVSNCMELLFRLFDQKEIKAGRFALSDYVWQEGTEALAQITVETRDLLMSYYSDCEKTYKDGLFILYNNYKQAPRAQG
jgi:hypothetical protein